MNGIPEYGTGQHEDYLSQQDERAELARDLAAEEAAREFAGWAEAQGYDDSELYSFAEMDEAFAAGMQAARDLAAHVAGPSAGPAAPHHFECAVFWGGEDPDDCAGSDVYGDETDADESRQWTIGGGLAKRAVWYGPWTVVTPSAAGLAPGEDPDDNLTDAEREDYRKWREAKGLQAR